MLFSQRIGKTPIKVQIQKDSMDQDLRMALWNAYKVFFVQDFIHESQFRPAGNCLGGSRYETFYKRLWVHFFKKPLNAFPLDFVELQKYIGGWYASAEWYDVYNFIEQLVVIESPANVDHFRRTCNGLLEQEVSGYRFVGDALTPIVNDEEIKEIEEAIANSQKTPLAGVNAHLKEALSKLSDRQNPDYRNSIKESISAVESLCQVIAGKTATLGQALKTVKDRVDLHPALEKAFSALYVYTNDAGGIRHAMIDPSSYQCDFEDAKYMLVACSGFINYLVGKAAKAGVKLT